MKIAIVGAGIVGSTAAYYLSKEKDVEVTVFDHGLGQATKAAAGIISPWFSKRRNKAWYRMARLALIHAAKMATCSLCHILPTWQIGVSLSSIRRGIMRFCVRLQWVRR